MGPFRPLLSALLFVGGLVLFGAMVLQSQPSAHASTASVSITSGGFSPQSINVSPGTTVTWTNNSGSPQTVNSLLPGTDPNFFYSGFIFAGASWSHTFASAGTFNYKSTTTNITGTVVVGSGTAPTNTPAPTPTPSGGGGGGGTGDVTITAGGFVPQSLNVSTGTTVTWYNSSGTPQTVNSLLPGTDPNFFSSGLIYAGQTWSHTFSSGGTFGYKSTTTNLTGSIVVGGGASTPPPSTSTPTPLPSTATPTSPAATATPTSAGAPATATSVPGSPSPTSPASTPTAPAGGGTSTPPASPPTSTPPSPTATNPSLPLGTPTVGAPPFTPVPTPVPPSSPGDPFGPMAAGWNLVTYAGPTAKPSTALRDLGDEWAAVYYWDGKNWKRYFRPGTAPDYLNNLGVVPGGQPLWIRATAPIP